LLRRDERVERAFFRSEKEKKAGGRGPRKGALEKKKRREKEKERTCGQARPNFGGWKKQKRRSKSAEEEHMGKRERIKASRKVLIDVGKKTGLGG